jgi:hypothetical protein
VCAERDRLSERNRREREREEWEMLELGDSGASAAMTPDAMQAGPHRW